jgi:hypothetical protein
VGCGTGEKPAAVPCDGNFIWPAEQGIKSAEILYRKGPDGSRGATMLAFVVWNEATVGRILRATAGTNASDLRLTISNITAARTAGIPDTGTASAGNASGGSAPPPPMPHVDEAIHFSQKYLDTAKLSARQINAAASQFLAFSDP